MLSLFILSRRWSIADTPYICWHNHAAISLHWQGFLLWVTSTKQLLQKIITRRKNSRMFRFLTNSALLCHSAQHRGFFWTSILWCENSKTFPLCSHSSFSKDRKETPQQMSTCLTSRRNLTRPTYDFMDGGKLVHDSAQSINSKRHM